jgi:hypothetical protein
MKFFFLFLLVGLCSKIAAQEAVHSSKVFVYPNPADSYQNVVVNTDYMEEFRFRLFTADGRTKLDTLLSSLIPQQVLQLPELANGVYIILVEVDESRYTQKTVLKKEEPSPFTFYLHPEPSGERIISLYPNPKAGSTPTLTLAAEAENITISIFSTSGALVWQALWQKEPYLASTSLSLPQLADGLYVVRVQGPGLNESRRLVVSN